MHRFWKRVLKSDGCWLWDGPPGSHGYGQALTDERRVTTAPRLAYELAYGPVPDGLFVCHHCDNKMCVRPDHLYAGTHAQNMDDVSKRGYHPKRKLTHAEARAVKQRLANGDALRAIARASGLSQRAVQRIRDGHSYRHVAA